MGGWSGGTRGGGGGGGGGTNNVNVIRFAISSIDGVKTIASATSLPAGAVVLECDVDITTPFQNGTTVEVGQTGSLSEFQTTIDNTAPVAGLYQKFQDSSASAAAPIVATVSSGGATGAGFVVVSYSVPSP